MVISKKNVITHAKFHKQITFSPVTFIYYVSKQLKLPMAIKIKVKTMNRHVTVWIILSQRVINWIIKSQFVYFNCISLWILLKLELSRFIYFVLGTAQFDKNILQIRKIYKSKFIKKTKKYLQPKEITTLFFSKCIQTLLIVDGWLFNDEGGERWFGEPVNSK